MNNLILNCFILVILLLASPVNATHCFMAKENNQFIVKEGDCSQRQPPCSTFKIAISLMGFDSEILQDETHPTWDFKPEYIDWLDRWKQPHNPKLWMTNSCVWYSQCITQQLGMAHFKEYVQRLHYGNQDTSGDKDKDNGLTHAWLSSSLAITPEEQIDFIGKLVANQLPVSIAAQEKTKNIMYLEALGDGWELYGKTGSGSQLDSNRQKIKDRQVGWFVGFARKGDRVVSFAYLIADEEKHDSYASFRAKDALKTRMDEILKHASNVA